MERQTLFCETERLVLRRLTPADYGALCAMLQDPQVMYAYEGAFDAQQVRDWLERQLARYAEPGLGWNGVLLKSSGALIGQCGLTWQQIPQGRVLEVGYMFCKEHWHRGYAAEAAAACRRYAFEVLGAEEVYSIIRDTNAPSRAVAVRGGMQWAGRFVKHYRGVDMPHDIYVLRRGGAAE